MGLSRATVDRGRAVYDVEDPAQTWYEGEPFAEQQLGPWFACRLSVERPSESANAPGMRGMAARGHVSLEQTATLILLTTYEDGSSLTDSTPGLGSFIAFQDGDLLWVESEASPDNVWHVNSGVEPIRKLKDVIGYLVGLRRARERTVVTGELEPQEGAEPPPRVVGEARALVAAEGGEVGL